MKYIYLKHSHPHPVFKAWLESQVHLRNDLIPTSNAHLFIQSPLLPWFVLILHCSLVKMQPPWSVWEEIIRVGIHLLYRLYRPGIGVE